MHFEHHPATSAGPLGEWLTTRDLATVFRTGESTIRYWRHAGTGPDGVRVGKRVLYRRDDVLRWLQEKRDAERRAAVAAEEAQDLVAAAVEAGLRDVARIYAERAAAGRPAGETQR